MPRGYLKTTEYALTDLTAVIKKEMRKQKINQTIVANQIGISQAAFSVKMSKDNLTVRELIVISRFLKIPSDLVGGIICGGD